MGEATCLQSCAKADVIEDAQRASAHWAFLCANLMEVPMSGSGLRWYHGAGADLALTCESTLSEGVIMNNKMSLATILLIGASAAISSLWLPGCASSSQQAVKRSERTVDSIGEFRKQIAAAGVQLDKTMAALDGVISGTGDRKAAFAAYTREVANLRKQGDEAKSRSESLQSRAKEYVTKWQQDVADVANPDLKAQADARRAAIQERIDEVQAMARAAGDAYRPLMQELTDIQTVLANDLTPANIEGVAPVAAKAHEDASALKQSLDAYAAVLDSLMSGIGPRAG